MDEAEISKMRELQRRHDEAIKRRIIIEKEFLLFLETLKTISRKWPDTEAGELAKEALWKMYSRNARA